MEQSNKDKLIDKIRKLLALSKSPNQHEAEAAMAKVNELITEHQISMSEIGQQQTIRSGIEEGQTVKESKTYRSFVKDIAKAAGMIFDCEVIGAGEQSAFFFVGLKEDILLAQELNRYLFDSWKAIVANDTAEWKSQYFYAPRQYEVKKYKIGHGQGFGDALILRAKALVKKRKDLLKASTPGTALVIMKQEMIKDFKSKQGYVNARGFKLQGSGYEDGKERGKNIPLGGAIDSKHGQEILRLIKEQKEN